MPETSPKKICFVIGPIGGDESEERVHADWLLNGVIKPVLANFPDFFVKRGDEDRRPGLIDVQMINDLLSADLVIADLSFLNPNAFYEIGIRHMAEMPIIHMQLATEILPFDVTSFRAIKFSRERYSDFERAQSELKLAVDAVLEPKYQLTNPVTNARGYIKLQQSADSETRVLLDEMDSIKSRLDSIHYLLRPRLTDNLRTRISIDAPGTARAEPVSRPQNSARVTGA